MLHDNSQSNIAGKSGTHLAYTHVDIIGAGFLWEVHSATNSSEFCVQIDGGTIYKAYSPSESMPFYLRFKTSLKVTCSTSAGGDAGAQYILD
jgi:hypothetical protein